MSYNPKSLFNKIQEHEQANANAAGGGFGNPLIFKPKINTTITARLLWLAPIDGCDREYPMINSYVHKVWNENATGQKEHRVVCPTSQYMMGETNAAFKKCPICAATSDFYKRGQEGSVSAAELYKTFRRTCIGYIPIYIVSGPEEDLHQVRILQYGKQFKDFFDRKIFGIMKKSKNGEDQSPIDPDEVIGLDAFMYHDGSTDSIVTDGYDLIITVTSKKMVIGGKSVDMPQYDLDFTRKKRSIKDLDGINLTTDEGIKYFNSLNGKVLNFDQDFYIKSTDAELQEFKLNYISKSDAEAADEDEEDIVQKPTIKLPTAKAKPVESHEDDSEDIDEIPMGNTAKARTQAKATTDLPLNANGEIDINKLIGDLG